MKRSWLLGVAAMVGAMVAASSWRGHAAQADKRVALVVGNAEYQYAGRLANPANDAKDVAAALGRLGFNVKRLDNASGGAMASAVEDFYAKTNGASVAFFYYAEHGL